MSQSLESLPIRSLYRALQATEAAVGPDSVSVRILRRAIAKKRQAARRARRRKGAAV